MNHRTRILVLLALVGISLVSGPVMARNWQVPYQAETVAAAMDSSAFGDVIQIAPGTYSVRDVILKDGVVVQSFTPTLEDEVVLDAGYAGQIFIGYSLSDQTRLEGLTFINGSGPYPGGGAISASDSYLQISNCVFRDNRTTVHGGDGGAMMFFASTPTIENCTFTDNTADDMGGGVFFNDCLGQPSITSCMFTGNHAGWGGGAVGSNGSAPLVEYSVFLSNTSPLGGGIFYYQGSSLKVVGSVFAGNQAENIGAVGGEGPFDISGSTFFGNGASEAGGCLGFGPLASGTLENSILSFSTAGGAVSLLEGASISLKYVDIWGNTGGDWDGLWDQFGLNGNFGADPGFCDSDVGDFHLCSDSWCLPGHLPDDPLHDLVGALGSGCGPCSPEVNESMTWGEVKVIYR